ncbi:hypothetical protein CRG98_044400 [Punica granatum]|uniref:Uncharacterized protein n=1 Tax=Punica granatum TaxID=22663 RepID=A0A2I0HU45_PUNGR|nr:hypothetical protein CRG98_044400 [Punica granatum]
MASPASSAESSLLSKLESLLSSFGHGPDDDDKIHSLFSGQVASYHFSKVEKCSAVQSPVRPQGSKAVKKKLKGKSKASRFGGHKDEKYGELKSQVARRLDLLEDLKKEKQKKSELMLLSMDTSIMSEEQ